MDIVLVSWRDSETMDSWVTLEAAKNWGLDSSSGMHQTVGWLLGQTDRWLLVATSIEQKPEPEQVGTLWRIPVGSIIDVTVILR